MKPERKIKVLLFTDRKSGNSLIFERIRKNLEFDLRAVGIEVTDDINDDYDIAHFVSAKDVLFLESILIKKKTPIVLQAFSDFEDFEFEPDVETPVLKKEALRLYNLVDAILVGYNSQKIILRHFNVTSPIEVIPPATEYTVDRADTYNQRAFRSFYGLPPTAPIIINYGIYDPENGFDAYEALARIMPDIEFFFFGVKTSIFNSSEHYNRNLSLRNLHYEGIMPTELYNSMMTSAAGFVLTGKFHVENVLLAEAMRAGVPIISARNGILFDLLVNEKTAVICENLDDFYRAIKNIGDPDLIRNAYETVSAVSYVQKGTELKELYLSLIDAV